MKDPVIARDVAEADVSKIVELFDGNVASENDRENLISAYQAGRITFDEAAETLKYTFAAPVELKTGGVLESVEFHEPTSADLEYINKGMRIQASENGSFTMELSDMYVKTVRMLSRICGVSIGVADKIKRRDMIVLNSICSFFG